METRNIFLVFLAIVLLNVLTGTSSVPLPDDDFSSEDIEEAMRMMSDLPVKRGMCPYGYTFMPITRRCKASRGELRRSGIKKIKSRLQALRGRAGRRRRY